MNKNKNKLYTILAMLIFGIILLISILIKKLTEEQIQIKCVDKSTEILKKQNLYYIIANHGDTKEEKFEIETPFLESNKELFNNFKKDSVYVVSVYGLKMPIFSRTITEIVKK